LRNASSEVDQRGNGIRDRDSVDPAAMLRTQPGAPVDLDAGAIPSELARNRNLEKWGRRHQAPQSGGAAMTEKSRRPTAQNGGHPAPVCAHIGPTDRVYTAPERMQAPFADPMLYRVWAHPHGQQVRTTHHAVLLHRKLPQPR